MVIPIGDDNTGRRTLPVVTTLLVVANVLAFLLELAQGAAIEEFVTRWAVIPREYAEGQDLPPTISFPFWVTTLTAMFLHGGWAHLAGNMLYLSIFGDNVEDRLGHGRFLAFYVLCGVAATAAQIAVDPRSTVPNVGASGAIAGVLAAYVVTFPRRRVRVLLFPFVMDLPAVWVIGSWIVTQFVLGVGQVVETRQTEGGGIAYAAHVGGFVAGLLLLAVLRRSRPAPA